MTFQIFFVEIFILYIDNTLKNFNYKIESKNRQEIENLNNILKKNPNIININVYYAR